jgi:hypothetical protein
MTTTHTFDDGTEVIRGSKKSHGNLLDGEKHEYDPFSSTLKSCEKINHTSLDPIERKRWKAALTTIRKGLEAFFEVGEALGEIKRSHLWREDYSSWEAFCSEVVEMSKTEANRLIRDAEVIRDLKAPIGAVDVGRQPLPVNPAQARALVRIKSPEQRRKAWDLAVQEANGDPVTAKTVGEVAARILGGDSPCQVKPMKKSPEQSTASVGDTKRYSYDILPRLQEARSLEDWQIVEEVIRHLENA